MEPVELTPQQGEALLETTPMARGPAMNPAYGCVTLWRYQDRFVAAIQVGGSTMWMELDSREAEHARLDPMRCLVMCQPGTIDWVLEHANLHGARAIQPATPGDKGPFWVVTTRYLHGPSESTELAGGPFPSYLEAERFADYVRNTAGSAACGEYAPRRIVVVAAEEARHG